MKGYGKAFDLYGSNKGFVEDALNIKNDYSVAVRKVTKITKGQIENERSRQSKTSIKFGWCLFKK